MGPREVAQLFTILVSGVAGLMVGSFLNVAIYRLPLGMSVVEPPSHCPSCGARLGLVDLVPVLSWLWLRGRCRHCGTHISVRYPLVELSTGLVCAAAAAAIGSVWPLPSVAVLAVCTLGAAAVDADGGAVPPAFALAGALAALSLFPIAFVHGHDVRVAWAALGALLGTLAAFVGDRPNAGQRRERELLAPRGPLRALGGCPARIALLACLAWAAGWLWPGGGALVAAWIVVSTAATGLRAGRRTPFAVLAAGSVVGMLASAAITRP